MLAAWAVWKVRVLLPGVQKRNERKEASCSLGFKVFRCGVSGFPDMKLVHLLSLEFRALNSLNPKTVHASGSKAFDMPSGMPL